MEKRSLEKERARGGKKKRKKTAASAARCEAAEARSPAKSGKKRRRDGSSRGSGGGGFGRGGGGGAAPHPAAGSGAATALARRYPFATSYADHFETPRRAYEDVAPFLDAAAAGASVSRAALRVYDPYYCDGAAERHLAALGFAGARNPAGEDFYETAAYRAHARGLEGDGGGGGGGGGAYESFDAFVTNPPYSEDHKERCLAFAFASRKPFALLLPAYVAEKAYFTALSERRRPFFLAPRGAPYDYAHPHGAGHDHSHFATVWVLDAGDAARTEAAFAALAAAPPSPRAALHRDVAALVAARVLRGAKRANPRQRKKRRAALGASSVISD